MKNQFFRTVFCVFLLSFLVHDGFTQSNWYVSPSGSNTPSSGTSTASPFQTIKYAVGYLASGDTLNVMTGTYQNATFGDGEFFKGQADCAIFLNDVHGSVGQNTVIRPYLNESAILKGDGLATVHIKNSSYIRLEGFESFGETNNIPLDTALQYQYLYEDEFGDLQYRVPPHTPDSILEDTILPILNNISRPTYFNTIGIAVVKSDHIEIVDNLVHHMPGEGIRAVSSDYIQITNNEVHNCARRSATGVHGISLYTMRSKDTDNSVKVVMDKNLVYDNYCELYSWSSTKTIITPHIDEGKGITVQRCTNNRGWVHGKIRIENNIAHHNGFAGVQINEGERVEIYNNTLYYNTRTSTVTGTGNQHGITAQNGSNFVDIYNNIIVTDTLLTFGKAINISSNSTNINIVDNLVVGQLSDGAEAIDINTLYADPEFVNASGFDFSLLSTSPAIDVANVSVAPMDDYFDEIRDATPDIGAIEYIPPLPIQLLSFHGRLNELGYVELTWQTMAELHNDYFLIEKSINGIDWEELEKVNSTDNSVGLSHYEALDKTPTIGEINYYRLKQIDYDGSFSYSQIIPIEINLNSPIFYPNPTSDYVFISGIDNEISQLKVFDINGKEKMLPQTYIDGNYKLDTSNLSSGIYFIAFGNTIHKIVVR